MTSERCQDSSKWILQASRRCLNAPGTSETAGNWKNQRKKIKKNVKLSGNRICSGLPMLWSDLDETWRKSSWGHPGPSYLVQNVDFHQKTEKINVQIFKKIRKIRIWPDFDLDSGTITFPAGSGEEILRRIRIWGSKFRIPPSRDQKLGKTT